MPHRIIPIIKGFEYITLNIASFGFVWLDIAVDNVSAGFASIPTWVSVIVGLSIAYFNAMRGYKAYKEAKNEKATRINK
jgi:hypothetical protein